MVIIKRRDPFGGLMSIQRDLDNIFSDFFVQPSISTIDNLPIMDVYTENDKEFVTEAYLAGFQPEDVEIKVQDNILEISGRHSEELEEKDKKRTYMMRQSATSFYRSVVLPKNIDNDKLKAEFENGVLKIRAPYKQQEPAKKVTVDLGKTSQNRGKRKETDG